MVGMNHLVIARGTTPPASDSDWAMLPVENLGAHTPIIANQQPEVMVYGQQGPTAQGARTIERGATGALNTYVIDRGLQLPLDATFGPAEVTEIVPGAWEYVYETESTLSPVDLCTQVAREFSVGGLDRDTFPGGQVESMVLSQGLAATGAGTSSDGLARAVFNMQYRPRATGVPNHLPAYVPPMFFSNADFLLSLGPDLDNLGEECLTEWALTYPTGWAENPCISTVGRDRGTRGTLPAPTIAQAWNYKHRDYYDAWTEGTVLAQRAKWEPTGAVYITGTTKPSVTVDIAAFRFTGEVPTESSSESTKQSIPAEVLHNGTDPMIRITVVSGEEPYEEES